MFQSELLSQLFRYRSNGSRDSAVSIYLEVTPRPHFRVRLPFLAVTSPFHSHTPRIKTKPKTLSRQNGHNGSTRYFNTPLLTQELEKVGRRRRYLQAEVKLGNSATDGEQHTLCLSISIICTVTRLVANHTQRCVNKYPACP
jgi:hypothetical protein